MTYVSPLLSLAGLYLVILASPGPNFFILSQLALDGRNREARHVVFGITSASVIWALLALAGLATLLAQHPWLASAVQVLGALYLVWYGGRMLLSALRAPAGRHRGTAPNASVTQSTGTYRTGLLTGLTNPKGAAFWTSAVAATLPTGAPGWFYVTALLMVAGLSFTWHLGVTLLFSSQPLRAAYLRVERATNALAGSVLIGLGLHRLVAR